MNPWEQWSFSSTAMSTWKQWLVTASEGANIAPNPQDEALKAHLEQAIAGAEGLDPGWKQKAEPLPKMPTFATLSVEMPDAAKTIDDIMQAQIKAIMQSVASKAELKAHAALAMKGKELAGAYFDELNTNPVAFTAEDTSHIGDSNVHLANQLIQQVPGLQKQVKMPCNHQGMATVQTCIMHLNDLHMPKGPAQVKDATENPKSRFWTRERIADWLDTLDVDLKVTAPGQEPWRLSIEKLWADAEMEAMLGDGKVTATLFNQNTKRSTRAQSLAALTDMVKAAKRRGHKFVVRVRVHPQMWQMDENGTVTHTPNWLDEKALEQVTAATKALVEALKPLADQAKAAAEILTKAIGENTQLLAVMGEVSKKKEDKEDAQDAG